MGMLPMLSDFPPRRIEVSILVYPGFELLDATGPSLGSGRSSARARSPTAPRASQASPLPRRAARLSCPRNVLRT
jgi:hypothetical protein